jgi:hypothetical protein
MRKTAFSILGLIIFCFFQTSAQVSIETVSQYKFKSNFSFTDEWQYLSTDLYLINSPKFTDLVNDMVNYDPLKKKKKKNKDAEYIEKLLLTANIKDVKFFGGDLTYPIYNFQISNDENEKYQVQTSATNEVIRIIDNLPLSAANDYISASITGEAISNKNPSRINTIVSSQLMSISRIGNPSSAVLSLVGEFGKFMESSNMGRQYKFNSTIRLYEGQDFNKHLHSISIYVFAPSGMGKLEFDASKLQAWLEKNPDGMLTSDVISQNVRFDKYPYLAIVNFKSKYITEPVVGDEINYQSIDQRKVKIQNAYNTNLINKETYTQELKLLEFLEVFAKLKLDIANYQVNYKNKITEDFSKSFFVIIQDFRKLKYTYKNRLTEFKNTPVFNNEFKPKYESIITNASLYLEQDNNLKNIKELVNSVYELEDGKENMLDSAGRETYLRKLNSLELPATEKNSEEALAIKRLVGNLEYTHYNKEFSEIVSQINKIAANDETLPQVNRIKSNINSTNCKSCKEKVNEAVVLFNQKYEVFQMNAMLKKSETNIKASKDQIYNYLVKEECIAKNFAKLYPDSLQAPAHIQMLKDEFKTLKQSLKDYQQSVKQLEAFITKGANIQKDELEKLKVLFNTADALGESLNAGFTNICNKQKALCNCE